MGSLKKEAMGDGVENYYHINTMKKLFSLGIAVMLLGTSYGTSFAQTAVAAPALDPQTAVILKQTLDALTKVISQMESATRQGALDPVAATRILDGIRGSLAGINSALGFSIAMESAPRAAKPRATAPAPTVTQAPAAMESRTAEPAPIVASEESAAEEVSALLSANDVEEATAPDAEGGLAAASSGTDFRKLGWLLPIIIVLAAVLFLRRRGQEEELATARTTPPAKNTAAEGSMGYPEAY